VEQRYRRSFDSPDEIAEAERLRSEIIHLAGITVSHDVHQPGWRWSVHVKPIVETEWCQLRHVGYVTGGRLRVALEDGHEFEVAKGDVMVIPAGHDAWVVGDEPFETLGWSGTRGWLGSLEAGLERVVANLVMTDIVGSTPLARRLGDRAWGELLEEFAAGARDAIARYRGVLVEMTGDGVLARFDGAVRAVHCAVAMRSAAAELGVPIRAVVHSGEVEIAEQRLRGVALHEAARMLSLANAGEILLSATARALANSPGLAFADHGDHELRGLQGSYRLYRLDVG
jgi:class 3 adenylate cyclase